MKGLIKRHIPLIKYGLISVGITIVDVVLSRAFEPVIGIIIANTIGVVAGFIIQYFLTTKYVFNRRDTHALIVFIGTFVLGLILANSIVWVVREYIFSGSDTMAAFLTSKGLSIVIPFFVLYYIRKKLLSGGEDNG